MLKKWQKQHRIFIVLLLGIFFLSGLLAVRYDRSWDITFSKRNQLSQTSIDLVTSLKEPLHIAAFVRGNPKVKSLISRLLQRYQQHGDVTWVFKNPDAEIDAIRQYGISRDGELLLRYNGQQMLVSTLNETAISRALYRLLQGKIKRVLFASGNGERHALTNEGDSYSQLKKQLEQHDIIIHSVDLSMSKGIPDNIDAVVLAAPERSYSESEAESINKYILKGGNVLWLAHQADGNEQPYLSQQLGVRFSTGHLIGQAGKSLGFDDPTYVPIIPKADNQSVLFKGLDSLVMFPSASPVMILPTETAQKWHPKTILKPTGEWLLKTDTTISAVTKPVALGLILTAQPPSPSQSAKVVLIGDADFMANQFIGQGQNREFALNIFRHLVTSDTTHIVIDNQLPSPVILSEQKLAYWALSVVLGVPCIILIIGFFVRRKMRL